MVVVQVEIVPVIEQRMHGAEQCGHGSGVLEAEGENFIFSFDFATENFGIERGPLHRTRGLLVGERTICDGGQSLRRIFPAAGGQDFEFIDRRSKTGNRRTDSHADKAGFDRLDLDFHGGGGAIAGQGGSRRNLIDFVPCGGIGRNLDGQRAKPAIRECTKAVAAEAEAPERLVSPEVEGEGCRVFVGDPGGVVAVKTVDEICRAVVEFDVRTSFTGHESDGSTGLRDWLISGEHAGGGDTGVSACGQREVFRDVGIFFLRRVFKCGEIIGVAKRAI